MKQSGKIFFAVIIFIIIAGLIASFYYGDIKETVEFNEFSIEIQSKNNDFIDMPTDDLIKEMYRCDSEDLTITSFDKNYIEKTYQNQTGEPIDFTQGLIRNLSDNNNSNIENLTDNLTRIIQTSNIDGYEDSDVAVIYHDDAHVIIVEGGDVDLITEVGESIKIKN
jgi:hypothetical protein